MILRPASVAAILLTAANYIVEPFFGLQCELINEILITKLLAAAFLGESFVDISSGQLWQVVVLESNGLKIRGKFQGNP